MISYVLLARLSTVNHSTYLHVLLDNACPFTVFIHFLYLDTVLLCMKQKITFCVRALEFEQKYTSFFFFSPSWTLVKIVNPFRFYTVYLTTVHCNIKYMTTRLENKLYIFILGGNTLLGIRKIGIFININTAFINI